MTPIGVRAVTEHGFKPFIDASCRREPDLESENPSITALCRQKMFAPNLYPNDIVIYMTVKGKWLKDFEHHRLIAILEVIHRKENHLQAALWYEKNCASGLPSNCIVSDNPPHDFHETAGNYDNDSDINRYLEYPIDKQRTIGARRINLWNNNYVAKANKWGAFIITRPIFIELNNPPILADSDMTTIFGKVPNTRNPNKVTKDQFRQLAKYADINFKSE
jgi:hypothetical protein